MSCSPLPLRNPRRGQALIEFTLTLVIILCVLTGAFELSRYCSLVLRMSSAVRETARLIVAEDIDPNPVRTVAENNAEIQTRLNNDIFPFVDNLIAPGNILNDGKIWVSYLTRQPSPTSPTDPLQDRIVVTYQFAYPPAALTDSRSSWNSTFGLPGSIVPTARIPLAGFSRGESTVAVELYHRTQFILPQTFLRTAKVDKVYDMAIF
ncbi:MAG: TadE/TadG family type IV pilus assembly protein [Verrucomicrobiia bacterium]